MGEAAGSGVEGLDLELDAEPSSTTIPVF